MSDEKIKVYKNKERNAPESHKSYIPQYQLMGVEPDEIKSAVVPEVRVSNQPPTNDNPRTRRLGIRQPYANPMSMDLNKGPVPNVGNNMEHSWSSVDGEIVDDLTDDHEIMSNRPIVDNNDYVSDEALGLPRSPSREELPSLDEMIHPPVKRFVEESIDADDINDVISKLTEGDYLLMIGGVSVCSGPAEEIEEQARLLVFGEHELCDGNPIPVDDIIVIKRVPIKIGLFLE